MGNLNLREEDWLTMQQVTEDRFVFNVDWYDKQADLYRSYLLTFYPGNNDIEMYDMKNKRKFLQRSPSNLTSAALFVGAIVTVNARQLKIIDYADTATRKGFARAKET